VRRKTFISVLMVVHVLLVGYASTRSIPYQNNAEAPKAVGFPIEIFESSQVNRPYKTLGIVQGNAGKRHNVKDTLEHLKSEARAMGGDALIDLQLGPSRGGVITPVGNSYVYGNLREVWSAKVIKWVQDPAKAESGNHGDSNRPLKNPPIVRCNSSYS
jgi:hypothetical protein